MQNPLNKIVSAIETVILSRVGNDKIYDQYYKRSDSHIPYTRVSIQYRTKVINDWKLAVMAATDPYYPCRGQLMRFYQSLMLDNHLASVIDSRILRVQRSSYKIINENGEENEELKKLLERPWYDDLVRMVVFKNFQGPTLIELFDLDENGELAKVKEIPQSNFIPQLGVITNYEGEFSGTSYREGAYSDYYIQVGDDWDLGMLNQLAMVVLAKKLGLGSWMSYIDKLGVPPVFVTTDRLDTQRRNELFKMLENFRANHFTVLQGNEKVEIPNDYNSDAYQSFKSLNEFADEQISKRVLGNTASTDKKSFVGAAEVQERVSQDRYEADKLLFKHFFNTQIRQRLAKLSSVYADFATHTIVFDNQETIAINDYIDGVQKLSQFYDFDTEKIALRTGLPIIGTKAVASPIIPPVTDPQKKKFNASVNLQYAPFARANFNIYAATWDAATERLSTQLYNGEIKPSDLDKDLVLKNYAALNKSAETAWGKDYYNETITRQMRDNIMKFSGAKSYDLMTKIAAVDSRGMTKEAYMEQAKNIVNIHNETYLNVEKQFTAASSASVKDWQQFAKDVDIYPNLMFRTMGDAAVREDHASLDGTIKPVNDPFWDASTPPLGWNCRCWLEQSTDDASTSIPNVEIPAEFAHNAGTDGCIFSDENSYFQSIANNDLTDVSDNSNLMKLFAPYNLAEKTGMGNNMFVSDFAEADGLPANKIAANKVADFLNTDIYIRPHVESSNGIKNPEFGIGKPNSLGDLKTYQGKSKFDNFMQSNIKKANNQGATTVVIDVSKATFTDESMKNRLSGSIMGDRNSNIDRVIFINGKHVSQITRKQIANKDFTSLNKPNKK